MEPEPGTQWPIAPRAIKNSSAAENRPSTTASPSCQVHWEAFSCQNLVSCGTAFEIQGKLRSQDPSKEARVPWDPCSGQGPQHTAALAWGTWWCMRGEGLKGIKVGALSSQYVHETDIQGPEFHIRWAFSLQASKRLSHWSHYQIIKVSCNRKTNLTLHFKGIWLDRNNTDITLINHLSLLPKPSAIINYFHISSCKR